MSNTINVNYMTRTYSNFLKNYGAKNGNRTKPASFSGIVAEKSAESRKASETEAAGDVSTKDMTMEEYKQYIRDKISQIPMHPSRMRESISVNISEAGFEAMKNDPEYEAWVLNDLRTGWAQPDEWAGICGGAYSTIYYGATKEECHAEMWSAGYRNGSGKNLFDSEAEDSFWERRAERKKRIETQVEEQQEKKRIQKEAYEKAAQDTIDYDEEAFDMVGPNAPQEVKDAWMEAAEKVNANGLGLSGNGMMSHISQMMVQRLTKMLKGETGNPDILGKTVESAIRATKKALYDLEHPLAYTPKSVEVEQARIKEKEFYTAFLERLEHCL